MRTIYDCGVDALLGDVVGSDRGTFENFRTYEPGDVVMDPTRSGYYWRAVRRVEPPFFTSLSRGEVPGESSAWVPAPTPAMQGAGTAYRPPSNFRGYWDNRQRYDGGSVVAYMSRYWRAIQTIDPPLLPSIQSGEVPGQSPAWWEIPQSEVVMGAAPPGGYTDPTMVRLFQAAVVALNSADPLLRLGAKMWPPTPREYDRIVDGILGPNTKKAAVRWNSHYMGKPQLGDAITDETIASLPKVTVVPKASPEWSAEMRAQQVPPTPQMPAPPRAVAPPTSSPQPLPVTAPLVAPTFLHREVAPGVPVWQAVLGALGAIGVGAGVYLARRRS